jgi:hypothetical protein
MGVRVYRPRPPSSKLSTAIQLANYDATYSIRRSATERRMWSTSRIWAHATPSAEAL